MIKKNKKYEIFKKIKDTKHKMRNIHNSKNLLDLIKIKDEINTDKEIKKFFEQYFEKKLGPSLIKYIKNYNLLSSENKIIYEKLDLPSYLKNVAIAASIFYFNPSIDEIIHFFKKTLEEKNKQEISLELIKSQIYNIYKDYLREKRNQLFKEKNDNYFDDLKKLIGLKILLKYDRNNEIKIPKRYKNLLFSSDPKKLYYELKKNNLKSILKSAEEILSNYLLVKENNKLKIIKTYLDKETYSDFLRDNKNFTEVILKEGILIEKIAKKLHSAKLLKTIKLKESKEPYKIKYPDLILIYDDGTIIPIDIKYKLTDKIKSEQINKLNYSYLNKEYIFKLLKENNLDFLGSFLNSLFKIKNGYFLTFKFTNKENIKVNNILYFEDFFNFDFKKFYYKHTNTLPLHSNQFKPLILSIYKKYLDKYHDRLIAIKKLQKELIM